MIWLAGHPSVAASSESVAPASEAAAWDHLRFTCSADHGCPSRRAIIGKDMSATDEKRRGWVLVRKWSQCQRGGQAVGIPEAADSCSVVTRHVTMRDALLSKESK